MSKKVIDLSQAREELSKKDKITSSSPNFVDGMGMEKETVYINGDVGDSKFLKDRPYLVGSTYFCKDCGAIITREGLFSSNTIETMNISEYYHRQKCMSIIDRVTPGGYKAHFDELMSEGRLRRLTPVEIEGYLVSEDVARKRAGGRPFYLTSQLGDDGIISSVVVHLKEREIDDVLRGEFEESIISHLHALKKYQDPEGEDGDILKTLAESNEYMVDVALFSSSIGPAALDSRQMPLIDATRGHIDLVELSYILADELNKETKNWGAGIEDVKKRYSLPAADALSLLSYAYKKGIPSSRCLAALDKATDTTMSIIEERVKEHRSRSIELLAKSVVEGIKRNNPDEDITVEEVKKDLEGLKLPDGVELNGEAKAIVVPTNEAIEKKLEKIRETGPESVKEQVDQLNKDKIRAMKSLDDLMSEIRRISKDSDASLAVLADALDEVTKNLKSIGGKKDE